MARSGGFSSYTDLKIAEKIGLDGAEIINNYTNSHVHTRWVHPVSYKDKNRARATKQNAPDTRNLGTKDKSAIGFLQQMSFHLHPELDFFNKYRVWYHVTKRMPDMQAETKRDRIKNPPTHLIGRHMTCGHSPITVESVLKEYWHIGILGLLYRGSPPESHVYTGIMVMKGFKYIEADAEYRIVIKDKDIKRRRHNDFEILLDGLSEDVLRMAYFAQRPFDDSSYSVDELIYWALGYNDEQCKLIAEAVRG